MRWIRRPGPGHRRPRRTFLRGRGPRPTASFFQASEAAWGLLTGWCGILLHGPSGPFIIRGMARTSSRRRRRTGAKRSTTPAAPPAEPVVETPKSEAPPAVVEHEPELPLAEPERAFATRVPPQEPERPWPLSRRVIFFDVENTSRPEHIARMIEHLSIDRQSSRTEFVAVGNWRVIGSDTGRLLARHGAHLVHSAPSTGVRDWSDLRIAVTAGVWLGGARPGDVLEIVSDDRAFDAVGDVASTLGVSFRRLSYRALIGAHMAPLPGEREAPDLRGRSRRGRRGRGGRSRHRPLHLAPAPVAPVERLPVREAPVDESAHSAPHDEIVGVVRELVERTPDHSVLIDTLANALKSRGFRRPPGSPRLITRLRRIKELSVSPTGMITLVAPLADDGDRPPTWETPTVPEPATAEVGEGHSRRRRRGRRGGRRRRRHSSATPPAI